MLRFPAICSLRSRVFLAAFGCLLCVWVVCHQQPTPAGRLCTYSRSRHMITARVYRTKRFGFVLLLCSPSVIYADAATVAITTQFVRIHIAKMRIRNKIYVQFHMHTARRHSLCMVFHWARIKRRCDRFKILKTTEHRAQTQLTPQQPNAVFNISFECRNMYYYHFIPKNPKQMNALHLQSVMCTRQK